MATSFEPNGVSGRTTGVDSASTDLASLFCREACLVAAVGPETAEDDRNPPPCGAYESLSC